MGFTRKAIAAGAAALILAGAAVPAWASRGDDFADVDRSAWYAADVKWAGDSGTMEGYAGTDVFGVGNELTRAELAQALANRAHASTLADSDTTGLPDLAGGGRWYTGACNWAVENGIVEGYDTPSGRVFGPDDPVTREMAVAVLYRYAQFMGASGAWEGYPLSWFPDSADVSPWAEPSMSWAAARHVLTGSERADGSRWIEPGRNVLREEFAKLLRRVLVSAEEDSASLDAPRYAHVGEAAEVSLYAPEGSKVEWSASDGGGFGPMAGAASGELGTSGGTAYFKADGDWTVRAEVETPDGGRAVLEREVRVLPAVRLAVSVPGCAKVGEGAEVELSCAPDGAARGVEWRVTLDGEEAPAGSWSGSLGDGGGSFVAEEAGRFGITASYTDESGRAFSSSAVLTAYAEGAATVLAPACSHTDEEFDAAASLAGQPALLKPRWTVERDGRELSGTELADAMTGSLDGTSPHIGFTAPGTYTLTASFAGADGGRYESSAEVVVYPVPTATVSISETRGWTDTRFGVSTSAEGVAEGSAVSWKVDNTYGFQPWGTFCDGELGADGGELRFRHQGVYSLTMEVTDPSGRTFSFQSANEATVLPVLQLSLTGPSHVYEREAADVRLYGNNDALPVDWSLSRDGEPADLASGADADLGRAGGRIALGGAGRYALTASVTDAFGRVHSATREIESRPDAALSFDVAAPERVHVGSAFQVAASAGSPGAEGVSWELLLGGRQIDWRTYVDGELGDGGGEIAVKGGTGDYALRATLVDRWGKRTVREVPLKVDNAAPEAPEVAVSVDYSDVEGAYTPQARAKVSLEPSSADPDGDAVAYEWDAGSAPEGRYGLGTHEARVRAVDEWGAASEWAVCEFEVSSAAPAAPEVAVSVDYSDVEGAYAPGAKAKATVTAANADADPSVRVSLDESSDLTGRYAIGSYAARATAVNRMGVSSSAEKPFEVSSEAPAAPEIEVSVDYSDVEGAYAPGARAKATAVASSADPDVRTSVTGGTGYYGLGSHEARAVAVNRMGLSAEASKAFEVAYADPAAPGIDVSVDYSDVEGAYTAQARAKATVTASNRDADPGVKVSVASGGTGYYGLGPHEARAVAVSRMGTTSGSSKAFEVSDEAPSAPTVSASVDYGDARGAYTPAGAVKVTGSASASPADASRALAPRIDWSADSAADGRGAYLGKGTHVLKARAVDAFGKLSDEASCEVELGAAAPTVSVSSSTLGDANNTTSPDVSYEVSTSGATKVRVAVTDYLDGSYRASAENPAGTGKAAFSGTFAKGQHVLVAQATDVFGNSSYGKRFFMIGSTSGGASADTSKSQTTTLLEPGLYSTDGKTPLAYIDDFDFDIPSISGHNSSGSDYAVVTGIKADGTRVELVRAHSSSGQTHVDSKTGKWSTDTGSGSFAWAKGTYTKVEFVYYNDHPGCLANATKGMTYNVGYSFIENDSEIDYGKLFG